MYGADGGREGIGALVAHDSDTLSPEAAQQRIARTACSTGRSLDLSNDDVVGQLQYGPRARAVTSPRIRTARPGPGKGWRSRISAGMPRSRPMRRTSSLKRSRSGSISFSFIVGRQAADVVVALDGLRRALDRGRLDHIGIERALHQPGDRRILAADVPGCARASSSKTAMNSLPMILRFGLRVGDARQPLDRKRSLASTATRLQAQLVAHVLLHLAETRSCAARRC